MKLNFKNSPTITSDDMEVSKMGLAEESAELFQYYLRSKIYSDKILAPIREYCSNALDENIKYNVDKPVEVKIENVNGQYIWSCRDHAKGLSESDIRNVFCMYGRSTKREDNTQQGSFGLGSKSFMAYTDSFYITSHFEGIKTQYACMLSAGNGGVPVGEIYKVSEEPTSESGIEVSADITKNYYDFDRKTIQFVNNFLPDANIIYTNPKHSDTYKPSQPLLTKKSGDYSVHLYDSNFDGSYNTSYVAIRMGGVVYRMVSDIRTINCNGKIVVDVPIGKLTIPISREDIEDTPSNRKVLDEISAIIEGIKKEDAAKIVVPAFGDSVLSEEYNSTYDGEWFQYSFSSVFPDTWNLKRKLEYIHTGYNHNIIGGKYTIYQIPNIKSYKSWVKRLDAFVAKLFPNTQIIWMKKPAQDIVSTDTLDLSDINFVDVKKLGIPKLPKQAGYTEYLMYFNGFKKGTYTAEGLDEYVTDKLFGDDGISDGWEKNIDSTSKLRSRVVGLKDDYGLSTNFWVCNSKKMYDQLLELGWFNPTSPEYIARIKELQDIERAKQDMDNAEYRVKSALFRLTNPSKRTILAIGKDPKKLSRLEKIKNDLMGENSFRGRVLKSMDNYNSKVTREDLRKLLTMK